MCGLLDGAGVFLAEERLELGECLLDGVEVGAVGRQKEELGADVADGTANRAGFVAADIIHHHDVARPQGWHQALDHPGQKARGVERSVEHARGNHAVIAEPRNESERFPVTMWHLGEQSLANPAAAVPPCHTCLGPRLVDEDNAPRINLALQTLP